MERKINFSNSTILIGCSILIIGITALFSRKILLSEAHEAYASVENYELVSNKNPINIEEILKENTNRKIEEEMVLDEIDLEYTTEYRNNPSIPKGTIQVLQEGRDGKQNAIIIKKYENGELISEELVAEIMEQMCQPKQKHIQKEKRYIKDIRLFTNSIRQSINIIKKSGMHVSYENNPKEDGFEIVIRVKK